MPHIAKNDRKKIQRSQTEGAKTQKSEDSTTGKRVGRTEFRSSHSKAISLRPKMTNLNYCSSKALSELQESTRHCGIKFKLSDSVRQVDREKTSQEGPSSSEKQSHSRYFLLLPSFCPSSPSHVLTSRRHCLLSRHRNLRS